MPYSTKADVKTVLGIDVTDTTYDTEFDACITPADGLIDSILKFHGLTVPLTGTIPQNIKDASKYFAPHTSESEELHRERLTSSTIEQWTS